MGKLHRSALRTCEQERRQAAIALEELFSAGYLELAEFETRTTAAYAAKTRGELDRLFDDIPMGAIPSAQLEYIANTVTGGGLSADVPDYKQGRRTRLGIFLLSSLATIVLSAITHEDLLLFIIPAVAIMLTLLRVGPARWYAKPPSIVERTAAYVGELTDPSRTWKRHSITR